MASSAQAALNQAAQELSSLLSQRAENAPAAAAHHSLQPPYAAQLGPRSQGSLLSLLESFYCGLPGTCRGLGPAGPVSIEALPQPAAGPASQPGLQTASVPMTSAAHPVDTMLERLAASACMALPPSEAASPAATAPAQDGVSPQARHPARRTGPGFTHSQQSSAFQAVPPRRPRRRSAGADRAGSLPLVPSAQRMHSNSSIASTQLLQRAQSIAALLSSQLAAPALLRRSASHGELAAVGWAQGTACPPPVITQQPGPQVPSCSTATSDSKGCSEKGAQGPGSGSPDPRAASDDTNSDRHGGGGASSRPHGYKRQLQQQDSPAEMRSAFAAAAQQPAKVARRDGQSPRGPPSPASSARGRQQQQYQQQPGWAGSPGGQQQQGGSTVSPPGASALGPARAGATSPSPLVFQPSPEQLAWALDIYTRHYLLRQQLGASAAGAAGKLPPEVLAILAAQLVCSQLKRAEWQLERSATV